MVTVIIIVTSLTMSFDRESLFLPCARRSPAQPRYLPSPAHASCPDALCCSPVFRTAVSFSVNLLKNCCKVWE